MLLHHNHSSLTTETEIGKETLSIDIHHIPTTTVTSKSFDFLGTSFKNRHLSSGANSIAASSSTSTMDSEEEENLQNNHNHADFKLLDFELEDELTGFSSTFCGLPTIPNSAMFPASLTETLPMEDEEMATVSKSAQYPSQPAPYMSACYDPSLNSMESCWPTQPMILRPRVSNPYYFVSSSSYSQQQLDNSNCALNNHLQQIYRPSLLKQVDTQQEISLNGKMEELQRLNKVNLFYKNFFFFNLKI